MNKKLKKKNNVTVQDIAKEVNISASTVSRALNNHPKISQSTKEKVWEVAEKLGYFPNIPVYMQQQKSNYIIFLIDNLQQKENHELISTAQNILTSKGYHSFIKFVPNNLLEFDLLESMKSSDIAGIISLLNSTPKTTKIFETITNKNIPLIKIHNSNVEDFQVSILPDLYNGAYLATNHLLKQGASNIALIIGNEDILQYSIMEDGLKSAMSESKSKFKIVKSNLNKEALNYEFEQLVISSVKFDGIICCNNLVTCQLYNFLNSRNISIPDETMLVSFGNENYLNFMFTGITTVEYSSISMGKKAAQEIINLINNKNYDKRLLVEPTKLIIRTSSMKT
ncbi:MAG: hypothetical protein COC22_03510 [Flavobacteriaceae bacterium]|nr:MAG: hypothetical protein COC22_03510 [Flavobacteriaceae bacterium]